MSGSFLIKLNRLISHQLFPLSPLATHNLVFVFMVGDGILNATLRSPVPLNDNEWHFVQAEINVKLARIKVDYQPWAVRRFPGQTFVTMTFSHPLLVGRLLRVKKGISNLTVPPPHVAHSIHNFVCGSLLLLLKVQPTAR